MNMALIQNLARALLIVGLIGLTSGCGYKTSSSSFISNGTGTTIAPTVTAISVEPFNSAVPRGLTRQFTATALYSNGTKADVSGSVTWSLGTTGTASITATGLLTAVNVGTTTVTATLGAVAGSTPVTVTAATLVSIDITPASPSVASGAQLQLLATGIYTDFSTQNLTTTVAWSSNTPLVATISNAAGTQGVATGVTSGTATITATLGAATGTTLLTVTGATLKSITVTPANPSVALGGTQPFTATGTYSNGTQQTLTNFVTWSAATPTVATISNTVGTQGLARSVTVGVTTISATLNGIVGSTNFNVTAATLVSIAVTAPTYSIAAGTTDQFTATGAYSDGTTANITGTVTWVSATPAIATIGNTLNTAGQALANTTGTTGTPGTTQITATLGAITSPAVTLTVTPATLVSISVKPAKPTIVIGETLQFVATGTYSDGAVAVFSAGAVTWSPTMPAFAKISNAAGTQGLATALSPGTTLITATDPATLIAGSTTLTVTSPHAYATNFGDGTVSQYNINPTDGTLTPLMEGGAAAPTVSAGLGPFSIAITPANTFAYVANFNPNNIANSNTISEYQISVTDGHLIPLGLVTTASNPNSVTLDPSGTHLYATDLNNVNNPPPGTTYTISQYSIGQDGLLAPLNAPPPITGAQPASLAINPTGTFAYVANYADGSVSQFMIAPDGALQTIPNEPAAVSAQTGASYVIVNPTGPYVYVTNQSAGTISEYSIGNDGALTNIGTTQRDPITSLGPSFIAIDATGSYAYVADSSSNDVSLYEIDKGNGLLTVVTSYMTGTGSRPYGLTIDATSKYLYVAERTTGNNIAQFAISPLDGTLLPLTPAAVAAGSNPTSIVTTP